MGFMSGGYLGAILGGINGAMQRKPMALDMGKYGAGPLWSQEQGAKFSGNALSHLDKVGSGKEIGISAQEMGRLTAGQRARLQATNQGQRAAATERAVSTGNAGRGGMLEASMTTLDDALLGQQRGLEADSANYALQQRGADRDRAVDANKATLQSTLTHRGQNMNPDLIAMQYGADSARANFAPTWQRILQGGAAGFLGSRTG